jgi:hypothetical protein
VHGKPRIKLPLTEEAPLSTTKSDGMCPIRYRLDDVHPTASVGHLAAAGSQLELIGLTAIQSFRMIRQGAADATVCVTLQGG